MIVKVPAYRLQGPKGRRYVFAPTGDGMVTVRRFEGGRMTREERLPVVTARRRWEWLKSLGYEM
jgi:hypothetical protein